MSLRSILADVCSVATISLSNANELNYTVQRINDAAEELYIAHDLVGCMREELFAWDLTQNQVALPYYVHAVRGMRFWRANINVQVQDMRPRYSNLARYTNSLQWRFKGYSATARDIANAAQLVVSIPDAVTDPVAVTITGTTDKAQNISETVTIPVGQTQATTTKSFIFVRTIAKSTATNYDVTVSDVDSNVIAIIPNNELTSRYSLFQLKEGYNPSTYATTYTQFLEVLYKTRFTPFVTEDDEFPCQMYDKAIYWKFLEHFYLQLGKQQDAQFAATKCNEVLANVARDNEEFFEMRLQFDPQGMYGMFNTFRGRMGYYEIPGDFRLQ